MRRLRRTTASGANRSRAASALVLLLVVPSRRAADRYAGARIRVRNRAPLSAQTRCLAEQGGMPVATRKHDSRERWIRSGAALSSGRRFAVKTALGSCMQKPRWMRHQHAAQRAARATSRARRPRISPSFLAHSGDVLDQRRALARAQGVLSRAERRFPTWRIGDDGRAPRLPDCFRTPPPSSVLVRPASPAPSPSKTMRPPVTSYGGRCRLRVLMDECG
jgi:hypothetical protein